MRLHAEVFLYADFRGNSLNMNSVTDRNTRAGETAYSANRNRVEELSSPINERLRLATVKSSTSVLIPSIKKIPAELRRRRPNFSLEPMHELYAVRRSLPRQKHIGHAVVEEYAACSFVGFRRFGCRHLRGYHGVGDVDGELAKQNLEGRIPPTISANRFARLSA